MTDKQQAFPDEMNRRGARKKLRNDIILVLVILLAVFALVLILYLTAERGSYAVVTYNGEEYARYHLTEDSVNEIKPDAGTNVIVIKDGKVFVSSATCPDGICVAHRAISSTSESIICLPNKLVVTIEGESKNADVDVAS